MLLITLLVALVTVSSVATYFALNRRLASIHVKSIVRNAETSEEESALQTAENLNYSDIFDLGGVNESGVAPFIDADFVKYFDSRFESQKEKMWSMYLNYSADVYLWEGVRVTYSSPPVDRVRFLDLNGTILIEHSYFARYANDSNGEIHEIQASEIDLALHNCYVVNMRFVYGESFAPDGGYMSSVYQTVVLDENLKPILVCLETSYAVA